MKKISVIVPVKNEENNIGECLTSLVSQKTKPYEIIIFNDNSEDKTGEIAHDFSKKYSFVRVVDLKDEKQINSTTYRPAYIKMLGIKDAKGDIIALLDADSIVSSDWTQKLLRAYEDKNVGCVGGPYYPINTKKRIPLIERLYLERIYYASKKQLRFLPGTNLSLDKKKSIKINIFENAPLKIGFDKHIQRKFIEAGFKIKFLRDNPAFSKAPETLLTFLKQRFLWGHGQPEAGLFKSKVFLGKIAITLSPFLFLLALLLYPLLIAILTLISITISAVTLSYKWKFDLSLALQLIFIKSIGHYAHALGYVHESLK